MVAGFDRLIVLDSIKTAGGKPGSWYRFRGSSLQETMNLSNVHDANFATALELGRRMGMKLPADDDIHVFAVEVDDNLSFGESLTPELEEALPEVADEILAEVCELIAAPTDGCRNRAIRSAGSTPFALELLRSFPEEPTDPRERRPYQHRSRQTRGHHDSRTCSDPLHGRRRDSTAAEPR